ncbi:hypothetical protein ACFOW6_01615 [Fodinicurvata halophila]|uniref:Uncharacterized protein n=1 Tax=Fodinicurvata halophila TaxID=1419723 RepID=A0ABV8UHA6_9PROT
MTEISRMSEGGYAYVPGVFQYSAGVAALSGFRIERVRFSEVVPLQEGFSRVAKHLESLGRPLAAFCACELRSPGQFSEEGFRTFNAAYGDVLRKWGIIRDEINPVARANVCPEGMGPDEPGFHAFCYTVPSEQEDHSFVIAGSGEAPEGKGNYRDHIIRRGDTSPEGVREKARWVLDEMERRMAFFGAGWQETTGVQLYTVHDVHELVPEEIVGRGAARHGLTWHFARPPVQELDYEMDCRRVFAEYVVNIR